MLFCETASGNANAFDDLAVFISQLNASGHSARTGFVSVPVGANRNHQFDIAPYLGEDCLEADDELILIGAHELADAKLIQLRRAGVNAGTTCYAIGKFPTLQSQIGTKAKLSYVLGKDPIVENLAATDVATADRCPVFGVAGKRSRAKTSKPVVMIVTPDLEQSHEARALMSLAVSRKMKVIVLTDGKSKQAWLSAHGNDIPFYHYGEVLPAILTARVDVCASFSGPSTNYRMQSVIANLAVQGAAMIDCSPGHKQGGVNDAFISGPLDLGALGTYLATEILDALPEIAEAVRASNFAASVDAARVLAFLAMPPTSAPAPAIAAAAQPGAPEKIVFMPTNGVGLGHAQRTSLIATEFNRSQVDPIFAAFPSCMKVLQNYGFDVMPLVSRSPFHAQEHENDLVNYARLRKLTETSKTFVFDGGYVFDSIYRTILENGLNGVWVRRGLWQGTQDNSIALDREKAFNRVIVPMEAFEELNQSYSRGDHIREVGPIVQRTRMTAEDRKALRAQIAERYGRDFKRLVVTMLGGGVAADRKAQLSAICGMVDRREDTLNLIIVWPTATVEAGCFAWENTRVVKTHHASSIVAAADLFVSAVGYNSFHEVVYNQVPAIFIPQMAAMMDDQRARAMAAVDRDCASIIEPHEMMTLNRLITEYLDGGRSEKVRDNLAALQLPEPGNAKAAQLIQEMSA